MCQNWLLTTEHYLLPSIHPTYNSSRRNADNSDPLAQFSSLVNDVVKLYIPSLFQGLRFPSEICCHFESWVPSLLKKSFGKKDLLLCGIMLKHDLFDDNCWPPVFNNRSVRFFCFSYIIEVALHKQPTFQPTLVRRICKFRKLFHISRCSGDWT